MKTRLIFLCLTPLLFAQAGPLPCFAEREIMRVLKPGQDTLRLPARGIEKGSVVVERNGRILQAGADFEADFDNGVVRFLSASALAETLRISFNEPSLALDTLFYRRRLADLPAAYDSAQAGGAAPPVSRDSGEGVSSILVNGSKSVSLAMGSGNAFSIDQALDLNIRGDLSEGVRINAILTDQNLPFQPEGSTESIRELDRVLVEVETDRLKGSLGDIVLEDRSTRFGNYSRKVKGGRAAYADGRFAASASGAVNEGLFHTATFPGMEQNQGPYRLKSREGREGVVVIAGTERVFVDGRQKKRGRDNDYTIEYGNGQITFTQNCLITADNVITAEYEYTELGYSRSALSAGAGASALDGKLKLRASLFREKDDGDSPLISPLSEADRKAMEGAGDSAVAGGAGVVPLPRDSIDLFRGFYVWADEPAFPDSHYVYHPPADSALFRGMPIYRVEFLEAGLNQGAYSESTLTDLSTDPALSGTYSRVHTFYRYVGAGNGNFRPGRKLDLPTGHLIGSVLGEWKAGELMEWRGEMTGSEYDGNVLSGKDDADNRGFAAINALTFRFGRYWKDAGSGRFTLRLNHEYLEPAFRPLENPYNAFSFWKKWNLLLPEGSPLALNLAEGSADYEPFQGLKIGAGGGGLKLNGNRAGRFMGEASFRGPSRSEALATQEIVESREADTLRALMRTAGSAGLCLWRLMPRAGVVSESKDNRLGGGLIGRSDMREYTAGLHTLAIGVFTGESEAAFRHDRVGLPGDPGTLRDSAKALTLTNHVFMEGPAAFSSDVSVTNRRSRRLERDRWNEYKSDLVSFNSLFQPFDNAVNHRFRYELSATRSQVLVDVYEPVGEGLGTHARDSLSGDYIEKEGGDYRYAGTRVDTQSSEQAVNASEISSRLALTFGRFKAVKDGAGLLRDLMSDTYLLLSEEKLADADDRAGLSAFRRYVPEVLPSGVEGSRTAKYRLDFKQEFTLHPPSDAFVLRLRFHPRFRFDYRRTGGDAFEKDEWQSRHYSIYGRYAAFSRLTLEHEPSVEWIDRKKDLSESAFDILNRRLFNQATLVATRVLSFPLAVTIGRSDNRHPLKPLEVPYAVVKPGIAATWPEKGRAELNYEYLYVKTGEKYLYYEMAEGNPAGRTHRVTLSARSAFFKNLESDLQYRGEKEETADAWTHRGSAQLKAYF